MIIFSKLRYKNFLSTGDRFTEIDFLRSPATLVTGGNGAGKSTMLDAIAFALFGKAHRNINKPQLVNSVNQKQALVEVEFEAGKKQYMIRRGIGPARFEIHMNGKLVDQSSTVRDYQLFLEQNILKMNYKTFHQVVVLGSSSFTPFMQLTANHRRQVIENLLDISVFTQMNQLLKEESARVRDETKDVTTQTSLLEGKVDMQTDHIAQLEAMADDQLAEKQQLIKDLTSQGKALAGKADGLQEKIDNSRAEYRVHKKEIDSKLKVVRERLATLGAEHKAASKHLTFFEHNDTCPTCTQDIEDEFKATKVRDLNHDVEVASGYIAEHEVEREDAMKLMDALSKVLDAIQRDEKRIAGYNSEAKQIMKQITSLQNEVSLLQKKTEDTVAAREALVDIEAQLSQYRDRKIALTEEMSYNSVAFEMLKDSGIKTKIIKQYLPPMNRLINEYLHILDFFVLFEMDESFNETILSRHRDSFSYSSFSEGEKQRIDLAILFTWRQIAKMKNSVATNLLILDETFDSSLDVDGIDNLMKILSTLDADTNVFVISHKGHLMAEKFEHGLKFEKVNNFSVMKEN